MCGLPQSGKYAMLCHIVMLFLSDFFGEFDNILVCWLRYEVIYPNGAYLQALADTWIRSTVPDVADDCLQVIVGGTVLVLLFTIHLSSRRMLF